MIHKVRDVQQKCFKERKASQEDLEFLNSMGQLDIVGFLLDELEHQRCKLTGVPQFSDELNKALCENAVVKVDC